MHSYFSRIKKNKIINHLEVFPCVALLGARQVGKSTLAKHILQDLDSIYLDLEDPRDFAKLQEPLAFLEANSDKLICIDEVQRKPEIFQVFRTYLDQSNKPGQLLLLGSASRDLIKQSSESLAGRISYIEISPFTASEVKDLTKLWVQGGYPVSYQLDEDNSFDWRINYTRTFLERDIPQLGINIPAETLRRFWVMLAHLNGELLNASKLASSMGVSVPTIKNYIDILEGTFIIRQLRAYHSNTGKRLIKSPKVYIRDSGLVHSLLGIESYNDLLGHPALGNSYETCVISSILEVFDRYEACFYRSAAGAEVDLILQKGNKKIAIEIKSSQSPSLSKGFFECLKDIKPDRAFVIAQIDEPYPIKDDVWVYDLVSFLKLKF